MKHEGRGVIRTGDKTNHGGYVMTTSSGTVVMGKEAALADDMTYCPTCKGNSQSNLMEKALDTKGVPSSHHLHFA